VAFVDVGHVIRVYDEDDRSILAALQLAQSKWGGVQVNGTEAYKRKCAELAARHGIKLTNPELKTEVEATQKSGMIKIKPEVGQRVTFHAYNAEVKLTGEVVSIDDSKGTVTLRAGRLSIPAFTSKGYFTETAPLEHTHTKEYACERAKQHVGENGFVFFARDEGVYRGPIVETTPTFAIQKTSLDTITLHRRKDLKDFDEKLLGNQYVVIRKTAGMGTVCIEPQQIEKEKDRGWGR
jgi:hypothetical protein